MTTFGSVCSGIEAASVAFGPLGWRAAWFSEIEPFPCAVLAHHYPEVPNLGDMTLLANAILDGDAEAPDVLCGGTPCQAFSVAGQRRSLDDERGNLSLTFCKIANAIDDVRQASGREPCTIFWENVPGVLSTKDNAFGCFLAELAGEDEPLVAPGNKWTNAGYVLGPERAIAWRTLDAQYFGLAQRRRRVFVVASARDGFDPAAVLFEFGGLRRDTAPSREAGQEAAPCVPSGAANGGTAHGARSGGAKEGLIAPAQAFGGNRTSGPIDVAPALNACGTASGRQDFETEAFLVQPTHALRGEGFDASEDGTGRGTPLVPVLPFDTTQITSATNRCRPEAGDPCHPLAAGAHAPAIAFPANLSATQHASTENLSPALGALNPTAVAIGADCFNGQLTGDVAATMGTRGSSQNASGPTLLQAVALAFDSKESNTLCNVELSPCLTTNGDTGKAGGRIAVQQAMQVRRLTPRECERLQGFPDDYTLIPWRNKPASECPDGPRYKALGNSWAVPVVRWIGRRLTASSF